MASSSKANGPLLVPPSNFAMVEDGVYRSAYPAEANVLYLRHIGITHIVLLSIEQLPGPVKRLLGSDVTGKASSNCLTRGPIRVMDIVDMRNWRVDGVNSGDDFSPHDVTRALDFAVDKRWHPVLFACPLGELQTNVLIGCMRRYQHWALSAIFSECELYASVCHTLRQSILHFIESWDPAHHPISAVNIQYRNRKMALRERLRAHEERRKHHHAAALEDDHDRTSESNSEENSMGEVEGKLPSTVTSDLLDRNWTHGNHSSTVSPMRCTFSDLSVGSTSPLIRLKVPSPDAALISTSGQRPPMTMRRAAAATAAARLREQQDQQLHRKTSLSEAEEQESFVQVEEGMLAGVIWAEWYLEALRVSGELKARSRGLLRTFNKGADASFGADLPPPHVLYACTRNPPALDSRSTFTKESVVEEDDD